MRKGTKKEGILADYSNYISEGMEEVGRDRNLNVQVTNIVKINRGKMPDSVFVLQRFASQICKTKYSAVVYQVLFYFIALTEFENFLSVDIKTISETLGITERSVIGATKKLVKDNVVIKIKHPSDKRRVDYFLNPQAMWKGNSIKRDKAIKALENTKTQLDLF
jgi:DNA-binding MarR family transcriptional regulator